MSKKEKIKKYIPFGIFRPELLQEMIEKCAADGYHLTKAGNMMATFHKDDIPTKRRYRVIHTTEWNLTSEVEKLYTEAGWTFIQCNRPHTIIIFTDDPEIEEPFIDRKSIAAYYKKKSIGYICLFFAGIIGFFINNDVSLLKEIFHNPIFFIYEYGIGSLFALIIGYIFAFIILSCIVVESVESIRGYRIYAKGELRKSNYSSKLYTAARRVDAALIIIAIIIVVIMLGGFLIHNDIDTDIRSLKHPVELEKLDADAWYRVEKYLDSDCHDDSCDVWAWYESHSLADEVCCYNVNINNKSGYPVKSYYLRYLDAKSDNICKILYDSYYDESINDGDAVTKLSENAFKAISYYDIDNSGAYQYIYVRNGDKMECICYDGDNDVMTFLDIIENDIR